MNSSRSLFSSTKGYIVFCKYDERCSCTTQKYFQTYLQLEMNTKLAAIIMASLSAAVAAAAAATNNNELQNTFDANERQTIHNAAKDMRHLKTSKNNN